MGRAIVVYESMFGNTKTVAEAVAEGVRGSMPVDVVEVGSAPVRLAQDVRLLVVGGPTHAFSMSRPDSRRSAAMEAPPGGLASQGIGLREWLEELQPARGVTAATFDTRVKKAFLPGSAARAARKRLDQRGFPTAAPPESFWVDGMQGPLREGELERARAWGAALGRGGDSVRLSA